MYPCKQVQHVLGIQRYSRAREGEGAKEGGVRRRRGEGGEATGEELHEEAGELIY